MNKMLKYGLAVVGGLMSCSAMAQPYVGAGLGAEHVGFQCSGTQSCDRTEGVAKALAGYEFSSGFA